MGVNVLMIAAIVLWAAPTLADVIELKDGRTFQGRIVEESPSRVRIDCLVASIRTTLEFPAHSVKAITREELPDDFFEPSRTRNKPSRPTTPAEPAKPRPPAAESTRYLVVPIAGQFGTDVTSEGIAEALDWAANRKIDHIVFHVDSPGGYLEEARQILDLLSKRSADFTMYAYIDDEAYSAAMVIVAASDVIIVSPAARFGAGTAYSFDIQTGSVEVDAKMNAAWASELTGVAATHGHPALLFEAAVEMPVQVYLERAPDGTCTFSRQSAPGRELVDSATEVLALNATQMLEWNIARGPCSALAEIGPLLGHEDWRAAGNAGAAAMDRAAAARKRLKHSFEDAQARLRSKFEEALAADPQSMPIWIYDSGTLAAKQQVMWRDMSDRAIALRLEAAQILHEIESLNRAAERQGAAMLVLDRDMLHQAFTLNDERLRWLQRNRVRYRVDDIK